MCRVGVRVAGGGNQRALEMKAISVRISINRENNDKLGLAGVRIHFEKYKKINVGRKKQADDRGP